MGLVVPPLSSRGRRPGWRSQLVSFTLLPRATPGEYERRAHALPGLRHASEHGSMISPTPAGLQQADTRAVTAPWGPVGDHTVLATV